MIFTLPPYEPYQRFHALQTARRPSSRQAPAWDALAEVIASAAIHRRETARVTSTDEQVRTDTDVRLAPRLVP